MDTRSKLKVISDILKSHYPETNFDNKDRIFDEILYIFLSWRTPIDTANKIYNSLKSRFPSDELFCALNEEEWYRILETGGKARDKSKTIVRLIRKLKEDFGEIKKIETLLTQSDSEVYKYLISLPGIKDKSAFCIMLYTMHRAVFPADAHCLRICQRLGVIDGDNSSKKDRVNGQITLNNILMGDFDLCYNLHIKLIQHGKRICKRIPDCSNCVIREYCEFGKNRILLNH